MFSRTLGGSAAAGGGRARLARRVLVGLLLFAHATWICVHLGLVAAEEINPWKLGGYGMYTVPHKDPLVHVFLLDAETQEWREIPRALRSFNTYRFNRANFWHVFRCRPPSSRSLVAFMEENPHLRYRPMTIVLTEVNFVRQPIAAKREAHATLQIAWGGKERFGYRGEVCGKAVEGTADFAEPT
ncbi:MAG TPA: hypothetical protein VMM55_11865 [Thermohalobaculum sp.]|nr:hypothetical protein [Thermohalobaculum sp.]